LGRLPGRTRAKTSSKATHQLRFIVRDLFGCRTVFLFQILGATECLSSVVTYGALWKIALGAAEMAHGEFPSLQAGRERPAMLNASAAYFWLF
jgi:hypothetical protein